MDITNQSVQDFADFLATKPLPGGRRKIASASTAAGYVQDVARFAAWFEQTNPDKVFSPPMVTAEDIQDYIAYLRAVKEQAANTVLRQHASIQAYCQWAVATGQVQHNESDGVGLPSKQKLAPKGLDRLQRRAVRRALNVAMKDTATAKLRLIRDRAIVLTLMYVGLRISEIETLRLPDVTLNAKSGEIEVRSGKGDKDRTAAIPKDARLALDEWLKARPPCAHDYVFVELRQRKDGYRPLGRRSIQQMLKELGERAGLDKSDATLTPHFLRHTAVHIWKERNIDPFTIAAQMGHEDINTTLRYGRASMNDLRRAAAQVDGVVNEDDN